MCAIASRASHGDGDDDDDVDDRKNTQHALVHACRA